MKPEELKKIDAQMTEGKTVEAGEEMQRILAANPDDWDAKLMLGACSLNNGDLETAKKLHEECEKHFSEKNPEAFPKEQYSFWQRYHRWIIAAGIAAVLAAGAAVVSETVSNKVPVVEVVRDPGDTVCYYAVVSEGAIIDGEQHTVDTFRPAD